MMLWASLVGEALIASCALFCYTTPQKEGIAMLCDCHMHMILDGLEWKNAIQRHREGTNDAWIRRQLETYRERGFAYLRDGGDRWGAGARAREFAPEYGITYRTPLANLCRRGRYGCFIGEGYDNFREYADLVRQHRADGADFIKIMISGLMDFDHYGVLTDVAYSAEDIRELVHIAHEEGFAVMAHANGAAVVEAAAMAGVDSVEHGAYLNRDALHAMKENGTVWCPTLSTIGNLKGKGRFDETAVSQILDSALENVYEFGRMGGLIAPGTDAGAWAVPHGSLTEFAWMQEALDADTDRILTAGAAKIMEKF